MDGVVEQLEVGRVAVAVAVHTVAGAGGGAGGAGVAVLIDPVTVVIAGADVDLGVFRRAIIGVRDPVPVKIVQRVGRLLAAGHGKQDKEGGEGGGSTNHEIPPYVKEDHTARGRPFGP